MQSNLLETNFRIPYVSSKRGDDVIVESDTHASAREYSVESTSRCSPADLRSQISSAGSSYAEVAEVFDRLRSPSPDVHMTNTTAGLLLPLVETDVCVGTACFLLDYV
jgi:hypothetical protein